MAVVLLSGQLGAFLSLWVMQVIKLHSHLSPGVCASLSIYLFLENGAELSLLFSLSLKLQWRNAVMLLSTCVHTDPWTLTDSALLHPCETLNNPILKQREDILLNYRMTLFASINGDVWGCPSCFSLYFQFLSLIFLSFWKLVLTYLIWYRKGRAVELACGSRYRNVRRHKEKRNQYIDNSWPGNSGKAVWNAECE